MIRVADVISGGRAAAQLVILSWLQNPDYAHERPRFFFERFSTRVMLPVFDFY